MGVDHPPAAGQQQAATAPTDLGAWRSGRRATIALALLGGAIAWGLMESLSPVFTVPEEYHVRELGAAKEKWDVLLPMQARTDRWNTILEFAWLGGLVAGLIAVGESIGRRSPQPLLVAAPVGAAGGCAAGWLGSLASRALGVPLVDLVQFVIVQTLSLGVLGIGVGAALGLAGKSPRRVVASSIAGMLAGVLAGALYPLAISLLAPGASTDSLIPKGAAPRFFWIETSAALLGLVIAGTAPRRGSRASPVP